MDVVQMFMELQVLVTIFLVTLFRFLQNRLPHREFFRWWTWAWVWFGVFLGTGSLSMSLGPDWTLPKALAVVGSVLAGFAQIPFIFFGVQSLHGRRVSRRWLRWGVGLALLAGAAFVSFSMAEIGFGLQGYALRSAPRQILLALTYFYAGAVLWLWPHPERSVGARVTAVSCVAGAALQLLNAARVLHPVVGEPWHGWLVGILDRLMLSDARWHYLDVAWQCGIALGMILFLLEDYARAENALRHSQQKFAKAFHASPDMVAMCRMEDGRAIEVNDSFLRATGHERHNVIGCSARELNFWADLKDRAQMMEMLKEAGGVRDLPMRFLTCQGNPRIGLISAERVDLGGVPHVLSVIRDITDRQRTEEALQWIAEDTTARQPEGFFATLTQKLASALQVRYAWVTECVDSTRQRVRILAFWKGEESGPLKEYDLEGTPCRTSVQEGKTAFYAERLQELFPHEEALARLNAHSYFGIPLLDSSGTPIGHLAVMDTCPMGPDLPNITMLRVFAARAGAELERERALRALQASEQRYREMVENANDVIYTRDLHGRFTSMNRRGLELSGYSLDQILQMNVLDLVAPEQRQHILQLMSSPNADTGGAYEVELIRADGESLWAEVSTRLILQEGEPVGVQGIARDITDRKGLEDQLRQAQKMEAIGLLAGGIAHDFNNLLMVISGYADLLLERLPPKHVARRHADQICKASHRAASLTRQLLAFSRKQVLQPRVTDLNEVVLELGKMLPRVIREDIELNILPAANLGRVLADPGQIEQVIMNLVVNARDAMPHGGKLTVETDNVLFGAENPPHHAQMSPGAYVLLAVRDTGTGMDAATLRRIFEPFFTTKEQGKGTGLGLAMVYGIVKQSGGFIWAYSEPGHGTTFKVYLPRVASESTVEEVAPPALTGGTETILLVEDEEAVRSLAREFLAAAGYTVLEAPGPAEALDLSVRHDGPIHLLLTDVVMPGMRGPELAERILALHPHTRVLFFSGYTDEAVVHHGILNRGAAFVEKPLVRSALVQRVRETLDRPQFASLPAISE